MIQLTHDPIDTHQLTESVRQHAAGAVLVIARQLKIKFIVLLIGNLMVFFWSQSGKTLTRYISMDFPQACRRMCSFPPFVKSPV